jgi:hypothetical protein
MMDYHGMMAVKSRATVPFKLDGPIPGIHLTSPSSLSKLTVERPVEEQLERLQGLFLLSAWSSPVSSKENI